MKTETVINEDGAEAEVVPAEVVQGLYDALNSLVTHWEEDGVLLDVAFGVAKDALAAADGEEV